MRLSAGRPSRREQRHAGHDDGFLSHPARDAGLPSKPEQHIDGISLVPLFEGEKLNHDTLVWHFSNYQGEGSDPASAIRKGPHKLIVNYHHDDVLLFDISRDPNETTDLADQIPDKASALEQELMDYLTQTDAVIPQPRKE